MAVSLLASSTTLPPRPSDTLSPGLPVNLPAMSWLAAWIEEYPRSIGFQMAKDLTVPFLTWLAISDGRPRPVTYTEANFFSSCTALAAAATPMVVGAMMAFRFG